MQTTPISSSLALGAKGVHQCAKVLKERNSSTAMWFFKRNAAAVGKFRPRLNSNSFSRQSRISFEVYLYEHIWSWSTSTHIHQKGMRVGGIHKTIPRKGRRKRENKNSGINKQLLFLVLLVPPPPAQCHAARCLVQLDRELKVQDHALLQPNYDHLQTHCKSIHYLTHQAVLVHPSKCICSVCTQCCLIFSMYLKCAHSSNKKIK